MEIKVINKSNNKLPKYATAGSAGMDLKADLSNWKVSSCQKGHLYEFDEEMDTLLLFSGGRVVIPTGLYLELPEGYEAQIRPRSGLAINFGITVLNAPGTIDADYRAEVGVILTNLSNEVFEIKHGDRIAQMVIAPYTRVVWEEVTELTNTERGENGFGSTGK